MQELRSLKSDSGFLSSGDSSVNGDLYQSSSNSSTISSGKFNQQQQQQATAPITTWGDKSIWGAPLSPTTTSSGKEIWSDCNSSSLWEATAAAAPIGKSSSQEWLGSIWMIPQSQQQQQQQKPASATTVVADAPLNYQTFKAEMSGFQLLRPHDIGNNMWSTTAAAASMSGIKLNPPSTNPTPNRSNLKAMRINSLAYGGSSAQPSSGAQFHPIQRPPLPPPPPQPQPAAQGSKFDLAQNACLQLFSDDFLNYFNTIH